MTLAQKLTGIRNEMNRNGICAGDTVEGINSFMERMRVVLSPESINSPRIAGIQVARGVKGQEPTVLIRAL